MFAAKNELLTRPSAVAAYQISRSLRFNSADSAYLNRTPASATNQKTWTWSGWVKRTGPGSPSNAIIPFFGVTVGQSDATYFAIGALDNVISIQGWNTAYLRTTAVYRDYSAWYHVVVALDTTQATAANRLKLYVNGVQETAFSYNTPPNQNADLPVNGNVAHNMFTDTGVGVAFLGGYLTEVNFIDGQQLTPSSFGSTNADTGVWQPKAFAGTYGTNGFKLNFSDNSNTTAATLGADSSGNGNNWTPNNFSVTAGAGNDSLVDSPTSYGGDTGVGGNVRGNYCTLNPLSNGGTLSNGNLDCVLTSVSGSRSIFATTGVSSGKWYWEMTITTFANVYYPGIGINTNTAASSNDQSGDTASGYMYLANGQKYNNGSLSGYGSSFTTNDVIGVAFDMDAGTITFYKNNTSQGTAFSGITGTAVPVVVGNTSAAGTMNFGQRPFAYTAPSGFLALCTQNLPTPTIGATTATQAGKYFNPVLWTGNNVANRAITNVGFQPDWTWLKARSYGAQFHNIVDSVRGATGSVMNTLYTNNDFAEVTTNSGNFTSYGYIKSLDSDGFTVTSGTQGAPTYGFAQVNWDGAGYGGPVTYVAWNWKANGSGSSNTSGSITSTVSANTTSGFSVVTYTGTGANATVGHGLGVAPSMIIIKNRPGVYNWRVWHTALSSTELLFLNTTDATQTSQTTAWNSTLPSSTVFSLGSSAGVNESAATFVAYCFAAIAGYSAFGSYTGNGSTDGPFVFTGMRPAFIFFKRSSDAGNSWRITDSTRSTYNLDDTAFLYPDSSGIENDSANDALDILSNGFKIRTANAPSNASGSTYIYMAFASNPFKYSLAR